MGFLDTAPAAAARRRILVSAYACRPGRGSEHAVGWNWVVQAARVGDVWLVTRARNREAIEAELARRPIPSLRVVYHDVPRALGFFKKGERGMYAYYYLWQATALPVARALHAAVRFDVGHHVTFCSLRVPSFLAFLDLPFVWGPLGGGDEMPARFLPGLGFRAALSMTLRTVSNRVLRLDPTVAWTARRARVVLATTDATRARLPRSTRRKTRIVQQIGHTPSAVPAGTPAGTARGPLGGGDVRLLYVGNLLSLKGLHLLIPAFAAAQRSCAALRLTVVGDGPERGRLEALARRHGVAERVTFAGLRPRDEVLRMYGEFDVFAFPSLIDSGGLVVLEAMDAGLPVICLGAGGPAITVDDTVGVRVPVSSPAATIAGLRDAIVRLAGDPALRASMGAAATARLTTEYAWDAKARLLGELYAG